MAANGTTRPATKRSVVLAPGDAERVDRLAAGSPLRRSELLRAAVRIGLAAIEQDPARLVRPARQGG